jgi:hypothetical protein
MSEENSTCFICLVIQADARIKEINVYPNEAEADEFATERTSYGELDPEWDDPDHWKKYDPPTVLVFEAENTKALDTGKYTRPVAVFQRGEKWVCTKVDLKP